MWVCVCTENMCLQKKSTTQNIRCPACTNPRCNTWITREIRSEQKKRKWERSGSNLRENKESDMVRDTWRETQMSSYLCHVLLALLCTDHSLNHLLYFGNKNSYPVLCPGLYDCVCCVVTLYYIQVKLLLSRHRNPRPGNSNTQWSCMTAC